MFLKIFVLLVLVHNVITREMLEKKSDLRYVSQNPDNIHVRIHMNSKLGHVHTGGVFNPRPDNINPVAKILNHIHIKLRPNPTRLPQWQSNSAGIPQGQSNFVGVPQWQQNPASIPQWQPNSPAMSQMQAGLSNLPPWQLNSDGVPHNLISNQWQPNYGSMLHWEPNLANPHLVSGHPAFNPVFQYQQNNPHNYPNANIPEDIESLEGNLQNSLHTNTNGQEKPPQHVQQGVSIDQENKLSADLPFVTSDTAPQSKPNPAMTTSVTDLNLNQFDQHPQNMTGHNHSTPITTSNTPTDVKPGQDQLESVEKKPAERPQNENLGSYIGHDNMITNNTHNENINPIDSTMIATTAVYATTEEAQQNDTSIDYGDYKLDTRRGED